MSALSTHLKVFLARELQRQFSSIDNSVGLFIAGTNYDASGVDSIDQEIKTRRQLQTCKLLDDNKVSLTIPRVNWTQDTIYDAYSYTADNLSRSYYVYTSERNVYVCVANGGGQKSIEEPTGTGSSLIYMSNGYVWKFMYKIPENLQDFVDDNYIPVAEVPLYTGKPFPYEDEKQLQYAVQYNSQGKVIEGINVVTVGQEYPYTIKASANHRCRSGSSTSKILLDARASTINGVYDDYTLRIISGKGAGQFSKIQDYAASGNQALLSTPFTTTPDETSRYEIIPSVAISGDGTGARAYVKMHSYASNTIDSVVISNKGSNYTNATATVTPPGLGTVLSVAVNPMDGLGRNPIFDLNAKRVSIFVKMQGRENQKAPLGNDYRQYGLWLSPKDLNGIVAGTKAFTQTKVDIEPIGTTFSNSFAQPGQFVFGSESYNLGRITNRTLPSFSVFGPTRGQLTLDGLDSPFKRNETVYIFEANNPDGTPSGGFTFTNRTAKVLNTLDGDAARVGAAQTFRCSHKLSVGRKDGGIFDPGNPFSAIPFDSSCTGGSGSSGVVLDFTGISGGSGDLYLTNVVTGSSADTNGFIGGETLAVNGLELSIEQFSPPELDLFSGQMLYITSIEQVTRNTEQIDLFKINFDF